ncbi:MAG: type II toxin-antitoxin system Phd/YefM family antitoxin [Deltaproteobacteria bacterium]|nr:type II toxin-antitoxin system Phd/YefM family antitoxin [Deltaproteobacteria bacterium]
METIGVKQLRDNISAILVKVQQGETIRILRHGKDIAELCPIAHSPEQKLLDNLKKGNQTMGGSGKIGPIRSAKNINPEKPISDLILEDRR